ncbi:hypothetical protein D7Y46_20210 [Stenotrophomonas maltophilia]|nr:hypothetical protein [Stenotrophomonas maltophilia]OWQ61063.1 hypothetical protein CEE59_03810 [Stenotrophomonas maltophilia]PZS91113.1 hypothetical protein A7X74_17550 [Stenotrophomonas maltophilia]HBC50873.1 hypothetical protein [Stenotrophomonas maltophilia]
MKKGAFLRSMALRRGAPIGTMPTIRWAAPCRPIRMILRVSTQMASATAEIPVAVPEAGETVKDQMALMIAMDQGRGVVA